MVAIKHFLDIEAIAGFTDGIYMSVVCIYTQTHGGEGGIATVKLCQLRYFTLDNCMFKNYKSI